MSWMIKKNLKRNKSLKYTMFAILQDTQTNQTVPLNITTLYYDGTP